MNEAGNAPFENCEDQIEVGPEAAGSRPASTRRVETGVTSASARRYFGAARETGETRTSRPSGEWGDSNYHVTGGQPVGITLRCPACGTAVAA